MNERIQKFKAQCTSHKWDGYGEEEIEVLDAEKFAELIVREFKGIVKDVYLNTEPEHRACLLEVDAIVDKHFGVK